MTPRCLVGFEIDDEVFASLERRERSPYQGEERAMWSIHLRAAAEREREHLRMCDRCTRPDTPDEFLSRHLYKMAREQFHMALLKASAPLSGQLTTVSSAALGYELRSDPYLIEIKRLRLQLLKQ